MTSEKSPYDNTLSDVPTESDGVAGSEEWADENLGFDRDPLNLKLYHCPRCGHDHETTRCYQHTYYNNPVPDDRENGVPFDAKSVIECKPGEWGRCDNCFGWCRKSDFTVQPIYQGTQNYCPGCAMPYTCLKCNECGIVRSQNEFERIKHAPYVKVWECWKCKSRDVSPTDEKEPECSRTLAKNDDPLNVMGMAPKGYTFILTDKIIKPGDIYWHCGKWHEVKAAFGKRVITFGSPVARKKSDYSSWDD